MDSDRYGESRAAYREVQTRHEEIQSIERTLEELAQLFNDVRSCLPLMKLILDVAIARFVCRERSG
jgi:t-SNARE complex subunit (syntaxin)